MNKLALSTLKLFIDFTNRFEIAAFLGWFIAIHLFEIIVFPSMMHPNQVLSNFSLTERFTLIWTTNADTAHYMAIAKQGYAEESPAFFPLWPIVIRMFGANPYIAKIIASFLTLGFLYVFMLLIKQLGFLKNSRESILAFLIFPASFMLVAPFSEPLYILLAVFTFLFGEKKRFTLAAVFAALASATRPAGIFLSVYLFLKLLQVQGFRRYAWTLLIAPLGLVLYALFLQISFGDWSLFYKGHAGWGRSLSFGSLQNLISEQGEIIRQIFGPVKPVPINFIQFALIPFFLIIATFAFKKLKKPLWMYCVLTIALPLASGSSMSIPRFFLSAFPLFIPLGYLLNKNRMIFYLYLFLGLFFQSLLILRFLNFEWVA